MSKAPGYIKIHRAMLDWEWYHDDRCVRMLLHLHLKANYMPGRWKGNEVSPGEMVTSSIALAEQLGWSRSAVNRTLEKLKKSGEVDTKSDNKWTLVSLRKWDKFQVDDLKPDTKSDKKRTTTGHQTGQQPDTIEEGEEVKKEKKARTSPEGDAADRRDPDVTDVVSFFEKALGGALDGSAKENRWRAKSLLSRMAKEYPDHDPVVSVKALITAAREDEFHKRNATSFDYLLRKSRAIVEARKARQENPKTQSDDQRQRDIATALAREVGRVA